MDPFVVFLVAAFEATSQYVQAEFPDAPPELQDWLTNLLFDYFFGDVILEHLFGSSANPGLMGGR